MKSIYVNGCSFSAGHKELQDRGGKAWPDLLKNHFHVRNDSMNGGSSFRALRQKEVKYGSLIISFTWVF